MQILLRILKSAPQLRKYYFSISIFTVLLALMNLIQPLLSGWAIDEIRKGHAASMQHVVILAVLIFVADLLANLFSNFGGYLGDQMSLLLNRHLSRSYFEHLLKLPQSYFDTELSGKIINRLNRSINQITNFMQMMSNTFLQFLFTTVFTLIIVAHYSWQVALMMLAIYPLYIFFTARTSGTWREYQKDKNTQFDLASGRFAEAINQIRVVKTYLQERHELKFFDNRYEEAISTNRPQSKYWHKHDIYRRLILNLIFFGIYLFIFTEGVRGNLSQGAVVSLILYGIQIRIPIFTISMLIDTWQRSVSDSKDYFEIMDMQPSIQDHTNAHELKVDKGAIEFKNVKFAYDEDSCILKGINISIAPHSKVALVGESGEGKSTLTSLLMRLYEPSEGEIVIDGQNIVDVSQESLRSKIGIVFQEAFLFSGTIRENIAYSRPNASMEDVERAARAANAHNFISKFENGYDTVIGERGLKLSGGQKQRIAIARAILKDAPILILDEATSSLDSRSEQMVQDALERLMQNRTTIIIAHRLSTIQHVDQIVTLKNGQVDEIGSPAELATSGGIYAQLLELQLYHTKKTEKKLKEFGFSD